MDFAAKLRDWLLLQQAITLKLNEQEDFVNWWEGAVTVRQSPGTNQHSSNAELRSTLSKSDAESETGISQQQVSRWRKRLKDRDKSEKELFETFYKLKYFVRCAIPMIKVPKPARRITSGIQQPNAFPTLRCRPDLVVGIPVFRAIAFLAFVSPEAFLQEKEKPGSPLRLFAIS